MKRHICLRRSYPLNFHKGCLPQISLDGLEYLDSFVIEENDLGFLQCVLLPVVWSFLISLGNFHFVKIVRIPSYSCPYFTTFGLNTERYGVCLRVQSECGKIRTRITPNTYTIYSVFSSRKYYS